MNDQIQNCLLTIEPYWFTGKDIAKLRENYRGRPYFEEKYLPTYTFNTHTGVVLDYAADYYQWVDGDDRYLLFDIQTSDRLLNEEIAQSGFPDLIKDDHEMLKDIIENKLYVHSGSDYQRMIPYAQYVVIELNYVCTHYEYYECDLYSGLIGHLNNKLEFVEYERENERVG